MEPISQQALQEHLGIFLFALVVSLITCFIAWYRSFFKWPPFDKSEVKINFRHILIVFAIYFFVAFIVSYLLFWILSGSSLQTKQKLSVEMDAVKAWINLISMSFVLIFVLIYLAKVNAEVRMNVLGEGANSGLKANLKSFGMGMVTWLISFPLVMATSQLSNVFLILFQWQSKEQVSVSFFKSTMNNPFLFGLTCFFVTLVFPLIEEIIFRGFLQNWFSKFLGRGGAVLVTSLIFSFFHFSKAQGHGNIEIISSLFVLACFLGFIYFRQKSIYASWGLHATFNGLNVLLMSLSKGSL